MKKLFGFGGKKKAATTSKSTIISETNKEAMANYKGQIYNPAEDDGITTESLFKVIDADTGEQIDVRELLGVSEEEFKANPELINALKHMNNIAPVGEARKGDNQEEAKLAREDRDPGKMTQKDRHFRYFEMLDTLPVNCRVETSAGDEEEEHAIELQAEGAEQTVISWNDWYKLKAETNKQLLEAIR